MTERPFNRIDTVFLPVRDLEAAAVWYARNLGLEELYREHGIVVLRAGETPLTLLRHRWPGLTDVSDDEVFEPVRQPTFNFFAPDIDAAHEKLRAVGARVTEIRDHGNLREFRFEDPDGNVVGVCWWGEGG